MEIRCASLEGKTVADGVPKVQQSKVTHPVLSPDQGSVLVVLSCANPVAPIVWSRPRQLSPGYSRVRCDESRDIQAATLCAAA